MYTSSNSIAYDIVILLFAIKRKSQYAPYLHTYKAITHKNGDINK